jgi:hypothetical protein
MKAHARTWFDHLLYRRRAAHIERDWRRRFVEVFTHHPDYTTPAPAKDEAEHLNIWAPFRRRVNLNTLRVCRAISGSSNPLTVPEEIFATDIERCLNYTEWSVFLSHKSLYGRIYPAGIFPDVYFHSIEGDALGEDLRPLASHELDSLIDALDYPVVLKPNTASSGGRGVTFPRSPEELRVEMRSSRDYVVQRPLKQHESFQALNRGGMNTVRVYTYRSVTTDDVHMLNCALRMGRDGSLDNETAGGLVCFVHEDGRLNHFAYDKYGTRFGSHPTSGLQFSDRHVVPRFDEMKALCTDLAAHIPFMRVAGWDLLLDEQERWRCIEVNLSGHTIRFAQYAGRPFFGEHTGEVIKYCLGHPRLKRAVRLMF